MLRHPPTTPDLSAKLAYDLHVRADAHGAAGRFEEALADYQRAAKLVPTGPVYPFNAGNVLRSLGRADEAVSAYDQAIAIQPDFAIAHHNRAFCLLQLGQLAEGFEAYEWRRSCPTFDDPRYKLGRQWTGQALRGKRLYIWPELYQGDMIQFSRYAALAAAAGAKVTLAAPPAMHALLRSLGPRVTLISDTAKPPAFDYQCALMSLPRYFGTTLDSIPRAPHLAADPARVAKWRERIGGEGLKIGVAWQGSTAPYALPLQRSFPLRELSPIAALPAVRLISLQKVNGLEQLDALPDGMKVETLGDEFDPGPQAFVDTAAAMMACDLFITPDTSVAHLAGALGVRTWVALPYVADWRWFMDRSDSPWSPATRLYRQTRRGEWSDVFAAMAADAGLLDA